MVRSLMILMHQRVMHIEQLNPAFHVIQLGDMRIVLSLKNRRESGIGQLGDVPE
jgi:hypothetical protein